MGLFLCLDESAHLNNRQQLFDQKVSMLLRNCLEKLNISKKPEHLEQIHKKIEPQRFLVEDYKDSFEYKFHQYSQIISTTIPGYRIVSKETSPKPFTCYIIRVTTTQLTFETEKRFTEFAEFHHQLKEKEKFNYQFPKKTIFHRGTNLEVIASRMKTLNKFLIRVLEEKSNLNIYFKLMKFLNLEDEYQKHQKQQKEFSTSKENLMSCWVSMNKMPEFIVQYAEKILNAVSQGRSKIKPEEIKEIFSGNEQWKSLIECCLSVDNQFVLKELILIIYKLLSPLTNQNSEIMLKCFIKIPVTKLKLKDQKLLQNIQLRKVYFEILNMYFETNDFTAQYILKDQYLQLYKEWKVKIEGEKSSEIHRNRIKFSDDSPKEFKESKKTKSAIKNQIEQCQKIIEQFTFSKSAFIEVNNLETKNLTLTFKRSEDKNLIQFQFSTQHDFYQCYEKLMKQTWNPLIICSKNDQFTNLLKQTWKIPHKQQKTMIFQEENEKNPDRKSSTQTNDEFEEYSEEKKRFIFLKKPLLSSQSYQSYFQKSIITEKDGRVMIQIWLYFHEESMKKYILSEIEGKTAFMWDGLIQQFN